MVVAYLQVLPTSAKDAQMWATPMRIKSDLLSDFWARCFSCPPALFSHVLFFEGLDARGQDLGPPDVANDVGGLKAVHHYETSYVAAQHAGGGIVERFVRKCGDRGRGTGFEDRHVARMIIFETSEQVSTRDQA